MAWGWFDQKHSESGDWTGFLEQGVNMEGTLETTGLFRIDSHMKGTIVSRETLIIGEHAVVQGEIRGNQVVISGRFHGVIHAASRVEIQAKAIVVGDIHSPCLIVEPGAAFDGQFTMISSSEAETAKSVTIPVKSIISSA